MLHSAAVLVPLKIALPVIFAALGYVVCAEREPSFTRAQLIKGLQEPVVPTPRAA